MLETKRLILRAMSENDIQDFYEIFNSDLVDRFVRKMSYEKVEKYFIKMKEKDPNPYSFAVVLKDNNKMIGVCGLKEKEKDIGSLSYVFNDKYWQKGYASEAVSELIDNAFKKWNFKEIKADCQFDNVASNIILKKHNFVFLYSEKHDNNRTQEKLLFNYYNLKNDKN